MEGHCQKGDETWKIREDWATGRETAVKVR